MLLARRNASPLPVALVLVSVLGSLGASGSPANARPLQRSSAGGFWLVLAARLVFPRPCRVELARAGVYSWLSARRGQLSC